MLKINCYCIIHYSSCWLSLQLNKLHRKSLTVAQCSCQTNRFSQSNINNVTITVSAERGKHCFSFTICNKSRTTRKNVPPQNDLPELTHDFVILWLCLTCREINWLFLYRLCFKLVTVFLLVYKAFFVFICLCRWHELECFGVGQSSRGAHLGKGNCCITFTISRHLFISM